MKMDEICEEVNFQLGLPANENVEGLQTERAVNLAFRELKRYMKTPVDKTVPFAHRIALADVGIKTKKVLNVQGAYPRIGLTLSTIDSGNVFQTAAAINVYSNIGNASAINIDPIMTELAMAQVRNTLSTDMQYKYDSLNNVLYIAFRDPIPAQITITYVPDFQDVSEIVSDTWVDYLVRMSLANMKVALGRTRSKYKIEGSNVSLDGDQLLTEGNQELTDIRQELGSKRRNMVILN
jgi:hypothetical protein